MVGRTTSATSTTLCRDAISFVHRRKEDPGLGGDGEGVAVIDGENLHSSMLTSCKRPYLARPVVNMPGQTHTTWCGHCHPGGRVLR